MLRSYIHCSLNTGRNAYLNLMFRVVSRTNRFNFQMLNYFCTLIESIGYTWSRNNCTFPFQKGVQTISYEYFDYLMVITYIHLVRLMKLADHKRQLMYTFQCMNQHIAGLSMFKLQNSTATCKFPTEQEINWCCQLLMPKEPKKT